MSVSTATQSAPPACNWRSVCCAATLFERDRKSTRLNSSHGYISYAVFCLKKKKKNSTCSMTITLQWLWTDDYFFISRENDCASVPCAKFTHLTDRPHTRS